MSEYSGVIESSCASLGIYWVGRVRCMGAGVITLCWTGQGETEALGR
jgi:hypothetical protein